MSKSKSKGPQTIKSFPWFIITPNRIIPLHQEEALFVNKALRLYNELTPIDALKDELSQSAKGDEKPIQWLLEKSVFPELTRKFMPTFIDVLSALSPTKALRESAIKRSRQLSIDSQGEDL
jgi:hypothetical protein